MVICLERGAYGPADVSAISITSCLITFKNGLPFWCRLTQVFLQKMPLLLLT